MHKSGGTKARGRTKITDNHAPDVGAQGAFPLEKKIDTNRPIGNGGGKNRGDRRDTNKQFTGNVRSSQNHVDTPGRAGNRHKQNRKTDV